MRPKDIDYERHTTLCYIGCSDLAAEMAHALTSATIVLKDNIVYSQKFIHSTKTLYKYAKSMKISTIDSRKFYSSSMYYIQ